MKEVILYTRDNCPLCEEAHALLQLFPVAIDVRDIERDDAWHCEYALAIPVVVIDGEELAGAALDFDNMNSKLG